MAIQTSWLDGIQERTHANQGYKIQLGTASATRRPLGCSAVEVEGPMKPPGLALALGSSPTFGKSQMFISRVPATPPQNQTDAGFVLFLA